MPGVLVLDENARSRLENLVIFDGCQQRHSVFGVGDGIERPHGLHPGAQQFAVAPLRFHLLDVRAVQEHDPHEIPGGRSTVDGILESLGNEGGQQAAVVDMGVGDQYEIDILGIICVQIPVTFLDFLVALVQAAIESKSFSGTFNDITRATDSPGCAHERDFHRVSSRSPCAERDGIIHFRKGKNRCIEKVTRGGTQHSPPGLHAS